MEALALIKASTGRMRRDADGVWGPAPCKFYDGWEMMLAMRLDGEAPAGSPPLVLWIVRAPSTTTPGGRDGAFVYVVTGGPSPVEWDGEKVVAAMAARQKRREAAGLDNYLALKPKDRGAAANTSPIPQTAPEQ